MNWKLSNAETFEPHPLWRGSHLQTVSRGLFRVAPRISWTRIKLLSDYGDYLNVDMYPAEGLPATRLLLLHGLTGCSGVSPIPELALGLSAHGVETWALNLRGADQESPSIPRLYHAGCSEDLDAVFRQLPQDTPWRFVGFSMGANLLLKWLGEDGGRTIPGAKAMAVSNPYDLAEVSANLEKTAMNRCYRLYLLQRLKLIVKRFDQAHPGVVDMSVVKSCRTFFEFDDNVTGPLHGFDGAQDYWERNSSTRFLSQIRVKTLLLHAIDDPFQPEPPRHVQNRKLEWEIHRHGGHLGFQERWKHDWLLWRIMDFVRTN
jgi:uncharacterized protein